MSRQKRYVNVIFKDFILATSLLPHYEIWGKLLSKNDTVLIYKNQIRNL